MCIKKYSRLVLPLPFFGFRMSNILTLSPVDNADLFLLIKALRLENDSKLGIREKLLKRGLLQLEDEQGNKIESRKAIIKRLGQLANMTTTTLPIQEEQWIDFASSVVSPALVSGSDVTEAIFAPLQAELARRTFITGGTKPGLADWSLFSLLFNRLKAMTPNVASKYYRVIRWMRQLQHILLQSLEDHEKGKGDAEVGTFVPAVFDLESIRAALDGTVLGDNKKKPTGAEKANKEKAVGDKKDGKGREQSKQAAAPRESLHPFARVDLRVGRIVKVEKHPNADRLYVEHVDLGEEEPRIVVSGLVEHVPLEELQDRLCIFICNLKPATLCKVLSSAMLLVAKDENGALEPLIPPTGSKPGDKVSIEGVTSDPDAVIKPKESTWEDVRLRLKMCNGAAQYEDRPLSVQDKGFIISNKVSQGVIS